MYTNVDVRTRSQPSLDDNDDRQSVTSSMACEPDNTQKWREQCVPQSTEILGLLSKARKNSAGMSVSLLGIGSHFASEGQVEINGWEKLDLGEFDI